MDPFSEAQICGIYSRFQPTVKMDPRGGNLEDTPSITARQLRMGHFVPADKLVHRLIGYVSGKGDTGGDRRNNPGVVREGEIGIPTANYDTPRLCARCTMRYEACANYITDVSLTRAGRAEFDQKVKLSARMQSKVAGQAAC